MAENIIPGSEEFSSGYMKPGVDEEINALWGRKMAANDGVYAGSLGQNLGHLRFMQGSVTVPENDYATAFLTQNGSDGGSRVFSQFPVITDFVSVAGLTNRLRVNDRGNYDYERGTGLLLDIRAGTMLIWHSEGFSSRTVIWTAIGW